MPLDGFELEGLLSEFVILMLRALNWICSDDMLASQYLSSAGLSGSVEQTHDIQSTALFIVDSLCEAHSLRGASIEEQPVLLY